MSRRLCRVGVLLVAIPTALVCLSGVAIAHVTVEPSAAVAGSDTVFTFRVPTEKEGASTVKIVLAMPTGLPIPAVSLESAPGWTAQVTRRDLAGPVQTEDGPVTTTVARITWSVADRASAIAPGQFGQFTIEAGPLPSVKQLVFKVLQYYSDGSLVRWIDPPVEDGESTHPAPTVTIRSGAGPAAVGSRAVPDAGWIVVAAFVAGLLGLAAGTAALVLARRSRTSA